MLVIDCACHMTATLLWCDHCVDDASKFIHKRRKKTASRHLLLLLLLAYTIKTNKQTRVQADRRQITWDVLLLRISVLKTANVL